jgi:hypothetical protein
MIKSNRSQSIGDGRTTDVSLRNLFLFALVAFSLITLLQAVLSPGLVRRFYPLPVDQGATWYYWQLGTTGTAARLSYWVGYAAHQLVVFGLLFSGRGIRPGSGQASRFNVLVLVTNLAFVLLHLAQTQIWYDGLAQDVPIWTSQGSVIGMLILILVLEMPRRGLFFGKWKRVPKLTYSFIQRWHGIYISWAIVYTFWFHPMEGNWGLLSGFIYMYLLFIQLSLYNTKLHTNPGWIVLMEAGVIIHGTLITVYKENPIWPMFLFGFFIMFSFTQVYAFKKRKTIHLAALIAYIGGAIAVYGFIRGFDHLYELTFIPVALYGGAIAIWLIGKIIEQVASRRLRT